MIILSEQTEKNFPDTVTDRPYTQYLKVIELIPGALRITPAKLSVALVCLCSLLSVPSASAADAVPPAAKPGIADTIADDYRGYFSKDRLTRLGIAIGLGGIAANTNIDTNIRNWYQDKVRNEQTDSWASSEDSNAAFRAKLFGEGKYMVPVALLAASVNYLDTDTAVGGWGANASRAYIVGLPAMWGMQFATGAARPSSYAPSGSAWRPFNQDGYAHGVSGHSFVGAVPFLTIAYMNPDNGWVKYPAYLASMAAGWSRINDDAHYPSQVVLGWYMAYEAVDTVFENNGKKKKGLTVAPMAGLDGFGLMAHAEW